MMEAEKNKRNIKNYTFTYNGKSVNINNAHKDGSVEKIEEDMLSIVFCNIEELNIFTEHELDVIASMTSDEMYKYMTPND